MKVLIIYGSTTGNTERLAGYIKEGLIESGIEVVLKDVKEVSVKEVEEYPGVLLGCSTWGEGELQEDFLDFYEKMGEASWQGKKVGVFGPGDKGMYPDSFCKAVDSIEEKAKELGADLISESLKIDGDVDAAADKAREWAKKLAARLKG